MTADRETQVVEWLAELWPVVTAEGLKANHCILAARVAVEVGTYFGVPITERAACCLVANTKGWRLILAEVPVADWPDDAWSLGIDPRDPRNDGLNGYAGHVIAESAHYLLDLSAAQFNRPERGLVIDEPMILPRPDPPDTTETWTYGGPNGTVMVYAPLADRRYRRAPDWRDEANWKPECAALIRMISARLKGERDE
jgi:hypothetical protein